MVCTLGIGSDEGVFIYDVVSLLKEHVETENLDKYEPRLLVDPDFKAKHEQLRKFIE